MEAMACGTPIFATRVGGIEDYLRDGINGLAIDRDASAIAATLAPVLADPTLLKRLGAGARATALDFAWPAVAAPYGALLREVWEQKQSSGPQGAS